MREKVTKEILEIRSPNILLELPTSFGKSKIALDLMNKRGFGKSILIVIPRLVLKAMWIAEFKKWGYEDIVKKLTFTTYISFHKHAGNWNYIIFDECHHLSQRCREALPSFKYDNAILLSATVKRDLKIEFYSLFKNLRVYSVQVKQATTQGVLPNPRVYLLPLQLDNRAQTQTIVRNKNKGNPLEIEFKDKWQYSNVKNRTILIKCTQLQYYNDLSSLIEWYRKKSNREVFKHIFLRLCGDRLKWLSDQKTGVVFEILAKLDKERTLTFCNGIKHTELLGTHCINSENKDASRNLRMFNSGRIKHITACNMLDEGVNLYNCRVGIYATLNSSERMIKQKLGRLLRHPNPIIIIPYYKNTRDEEIVKKMCEDYDQNLIKEITNINEITL